MTGEQAKLLRIYLQDHYAGSSGGAQLARRICGALEGPRREEMEAIAREIGDDREALRDLMQRFRIDPDRLKQTAAQAGELLGRLKLNGRILSPSPLSRVLELEGMIMGVTGKLNLWLSLLELVPAEEALAEAELKRLIERAEGQRQRLQALHQEAARAAFGASQPAGAGQSRRA